MSFRFAIVGDSNVKRHMSTINCRDRPLMSGAQIVPCGRLVTLSESIKSVRAKVNVVILSCVTNFITGAKNVSTTAALHVEPILTECLQVLSDACAERPDVQFLLCPPMYRSTPVWYRDAMPEILRKFSEALKSRPATLHLMPSFPTPAYEPDGIHLTAYSGLEFVLHLFDSANELLASASLEQGALNCKTSEATRVLEDRMVAIEQDHRRLSREFEAKSIVDAELACLQENLRFEDHFVIQGLARLPDLSPRDWQTRALQDVKDALSLFLDPAHVVTPVYVQNVTGAGKSAVVTYQVRMTCIEHCKMLRGKYSGFFTAGKDTRPPGLKKVSIRNRVSKATPVRIALLRLMGERHVAANPGTSFKVLGYEPRPLLKIFPAKGSDERVKTFNYVEAIQFFPTNFSAAELEPALFKVSPKLKGKVHQIFGVIDDEMVRRAHREREKSGPKGAKGKPTSHQAEAAEDQTSSETSGEEEEEDLSNAPPSSTRKRGASSALSGVAKAAKAGKSGRK